MMYDICEKSLYGLMATTIVMFLILIFNLAMGSDPFAPVTGWEKFFMEYYLILDAFFAVTFFVANAIRESDWDF